LSITRVLWSDEESRAPVEKIAKLAFRIARAVSGDQLLVFAGWSGRMDAAPDPEFEIEEAADTEEGGR